MMRRFFIFVWILLSAACSPPVARPLSSLRISFNTHPVTVDPRKSGDFASSTLICLIYEGLTRCLPDGSSEPALAERFDLSTDGKIYTFHLREAYWSDGKPITAYDFEKSWKKILDPSFPSLCGYLLFPIKNAQKCAKGELAVEEVGIQSLNPTTLQVELERPTPYFYSLTSFPLFLPIPSHIEEKDPDWDKRSQLICSGPFFLDKCITNAEIFLVKNPNFWNKSEIFIDEIQISIVADEMTALQMYERNELDWIGGPFAPLPPDSLEILQKKQQLHFIPSAATTFCAFNTEQFPFHNLHLRKAFSCAIDRNEIVQKIAQLGQLPATRCLPPSLFDNRNKTLYPSNDRELARLYFHKAMEELKIDSSALEFLTLYHRPGQIDKRLAQALQRQWKEVLGITIQLEQLDFKCHMQRLQKRDYHLSLAFWIAQFHDPINILDRFKERKNLKNYPGWEDPDYALLLEDASFANDPIQRTELLEKAESIFADQMPIAPLYHWSNPYLCSPKIDTVSVSLSGGILFERFKLKNTPD